jgi:hypothetical protein
MTTDPGIRHACQQILLTLNTPLLPFGPIADLDWQAITLHYDSMSSGEQLTVDLAQDIWLGRHKVSAVQLVEKLPKDRVELMFDLLLGLSSR